MTNIRQIHQYMTDRRRVLLDDGRTGRIVRVDTVFPKGSTIVTVWTDNAQGPGVTKVDLAAVVGPVAKRPSAA